MPRSPSAGAASCGVRRIIDAPWMRRSAAPPICRVACGRRGTPPTTSGLPEESLRRESEPHPGLWKQICDQRVSRGVTNAPAPAIDPETFRTTRVALHTLAEHLLASDLAGRVGKIGLRSTPGGFGQPETVADGIRHRIRVDGTSIVVLRGDLEDWEAITTPAAAAVFAGVRLGDTEGETTLDKDVALDIDLAAAARIAEWFALVDSALAEMRRRHRARRPTIAQLWPEHFDLAFSMTEVNLGGSPGDHDHDEPYLYVGPWFPVTGEPWNEAWGTSRLASAVRTVDDAVEFFEFGFAAALEVSRNDADER